MNPKAMPLKDYIAETMATLKESPESTEIVSGRVRPMRFAEHGDYGSFFKPIQRGMAFVATALVIFSICLEEAGCSCAAPQQLRKSIIIQ